MGELSIPGQEEKSTNLSDLSENETEEKIVKRMVMQYISEFSGPIPPPSIIEEYEKLFPGSADRIMTMAENQIAHRMAMEKKMIDSESRDGFWGIVFGFILAFFCIVAAIVIVWRVPSSAAAVAGCLLGASGVSGIVISMIRNTRPKSGEPEKNEQDNNDDS